VLSLYFNCKIVNTGLSNSKVGNGCFYPICYPSNRSFDAKVSSFRVLLETLRTLSSISFEFAIFNIDLSDMKGVIHENDIKLLIDECFSTSTIILNFSRPSKVKDWLKDSKKLIEIVGKNSPVLVMFNHDHPYIDYNVDLFTEVIGNVFSKKVDNKNKLLHFTHIPESISSIYSLEKSEYDENTGVIKVDKYDEFIHSTSIMTAPTLLNIWKNIKFDGHYIGRIDWMGVTMKKTKFTHYVFGREFFKHFDGYGNSNGNRMISDLEIDGIELQFPTKGRSDQIVNFYFHRFLDTYLIYIQDGMQSKRFFQSEGQRYIELIENSLQLFKFSYIEMDYRYGCLSFSEEETYHMVRERIYLNGNKIFNDVYINNLIRKKNILNEFRIKLRKFVPTILVIRVRKIIVWFGWLFRR
jgi:hypothetical protein